MLIQADTKTREVFIKFDDGSTIDVRGWHRKSDTGYLKDGETVEFPDYCTATRMGSYVMWIDPALFPSPRRVRTQRALKKRAERRKKAR